METENRGQWMEGSVDGCSTGLFRAVKRLCMIWWVCVITQNTEHQEQTLR
jgi:hypothetical protein